MAALHFVSPWPDSGVGVAAAGEQLFSFFGVRNGAI